MRNEDWVSNLTKSVSQYFVHLKYFSGTKNDLVIEISYLKCVNSEGYDSNVNEEHNVDILYERFNGLDTKRLSEKSFIATKTIGLPFIPPLVDQLSFLHVNHVPYCFLASCHTSLAGQPGLHLHLGVLKEISLIIIVVFKVQ